MSACRKVCAARTNDVRPVRLHIERGTQPVDSTKHLKMLNLEFGNSTHFVYDILDIDMTDQPLQKKPILSPKDFLPDWWEFWKTLPIAWKFLRNEQIPTNAKIAYILAALFFAAYVIFPIDVVPELFLPLIGYIDDLGTIPAFLGITTMFNSWCQKRLVQ